MSAAGSRLQEWRFHGSQVQGSQCRNQAASADTRRNHNKYRLLAMMLVIVLGLALRSPSNFAASHCSRDIRINNMVGNALFTLLFRSVSGELHDLTDVGESLGYGATAGYLFFKSRQLIGAGDESRGIATSYLASSITENTTYGRHPLSHLRYGLGPMEIKWSTPWAVGGANQLSFNLNAIDALGMVSMVVSGGAGNFRLRNGIMTGDDYGRVAPEFSAYTLNRTIVMRPEYGKDQGLWHHEMIHTTQYLQYSSFGSDNFDVVDWKKVDMFGLSNGIAKTGIDMNLRVEWFNSVLNSIDHQNNYEDRGRELEAARMGQNTSPRHDIHDDSCSAQVGFQFKF